MVLLTIELTYTGPEKETVRDENHITLTSRKRKDKGWKGNLSRTSTWEERMNDLLSKTERGDDWLLPFLTYIFFLFLYYLR